MYSSAPVHQLYIAVPFTDRTSDDIAIYKLNGDFVNEENTIIFE